MDLLWDGLREAFGLLVRGDPEVRAIAWRSIEISATATLLSLLAGVPAGALLALSPLPGRRSVVALVNTGMGLPPVVVGLFISITLWRSGPLGFLELLYTPAAMVLAQVVIAFPIVAGLTLAAVQQLNPNLRLQLLALGASRVPPLGLLLPGGRLPPPPAPTAGAAAGVPPARRPWASGGGNRPPSHPLAHGRRA